VVQATPFRVLPQVTSGTTVVVTLVAMLPALVRLLRRPLPGQLWHAVVYCSLCSFMFGYHVHEKAILMTLIPMAVGIVLLDKGKGRPRGNHRYLFLSVVGTYSLFPLLPGGEAYLPLMLVSCYCAVGVTWTWWGLVLDQLRFYS
jgi:alpha-1,3-glucosyltransferase